MLLLIAWAEISSTIFEICIVPLFGLITGFLITWINTKRKEALVRTNNEIAQKFINIAADVINSCVIATTETYVKSMKDQNLFDEIAQKAAFERTKTSVMDTFVRRSKNLVNNFVWRS